MLLHDKVMTVKCAYYVNIGNHNRLSLSELTNSMTEMSVLRVISQPLYIYFTREIYFFFKITALKIDITGIIELTI